MITFFNEGPKTAIIPKARMRGRKGHESIHHPLDYQVHRVRQDMR